MAIPQYFRKKLSGCGAKKNLQTVAGWCAENKKIEFRILA